MEFGSSYRKRYVEYNDPQQIKDLDSHSWNSSYNIVPSGSTGRHLYQELYPEKNPCFRKEASESHYINGFTKGELPDHSSRFGYANGCPNGYCLGHFPGKYIVPPGCCDKDLLPPDCAPKRFYNKYHTDPNFINSQAITDYNWITHGEIPIYYNKDYEK
jgi:hypothetical protein